MHFSLAWMIDIFFALSPFLDHIDCLGVVCHCSIKYKEKEYFFPTILKGLSIEDLFGNELESPRLCNFVRISSYESRVGEIFLELMCWKHPDILIKISSLTCKSIFSYLLCQLGQN